MGAEVHRVWTKAEEVVVELRLDGARHRAAAVVAHRRQDGAERTGALESDEAGETAIATLSLSALDALGPDREEWALLIRGSDGEDLPLTARADDDVPDKAASYVFAARVVAGAADRRRYRPVYDADDALVIRSTAVRAAADPSAGDRAPARVRRRLKGRLILGAHRVAVAALRAALRLRSRPRARDAHPRVTILLAHAYGIGGTTRTALNTAGYLAERHDVEVLSIVRRREQPLLEHPPGVTVTVVDDQLAPATGPLGRLLTRLPSVLLLPVDRRMAAWASLRTDLRLVRVLWRVRDGVVMGTRPSLNVLAATLRRPGLLAVGQEHMNLEAHRPDMRAELMRCYPRLDAAVLLTDQDRASFRAALGDATELVTIPNAVPALPGPGSSLDRPVVVAVGRLTPQKGFDRLIPAFARVVERQPDWTLRICGGGRLRRELEELVIEHDLSNHVTLLGSVRHVERQLSAASMFVLSSRFEGLPMAMIEAMSKNLPVVAFDCPTGPAAVVEHERSGLLVPNGDVDALAAAILALIEDAPRRRAYGAAAAERAREFSLGAVGARWDHLLMGLR